MKPAVVLPCPFPPMLLAMRARVGTLLLACALALPAGARAERGDRDKPINIEADSMQYDDLKQVNVFDGKVTLTRGTLTIRADRITMREDPQGYQYASATGRPASFRQKRDGPGEQWINGVAGQLEYDGKAETLKLIRQASLKRLSGERVTDEVHGNLITYDSRSEFFSVDGGGQSAATPENPGGRVRVVIQPRSPAAEPPASVPLAPAPRLGDRPR